MIQHKMPRRIWGKTGCSIPVIPLGTAGFGSVHGLVSEESAFELMKRAVDLGIDHFDGAPCYGDSMKKLAKAFHDGVVRRGDIILDTKVCCHNEEQCRMGADKALESVERQLEILGIDSFDAVLVHDPTNIDPILAPGGVLDGLERAKARGLTRWIGFGMGPLEYHIKAIESGRTDILLTYGKYNLLNQEAAREVLPAAHKAGIGVLSAWSIYMGLLTGADLSDRNMNDPYTARAVRMRSWCIENNVSLLELAIHFCLREQRINGNPIAPKTVPELEANISAVNAVVDDDLIGRFPAMKF